MWEWERGLCALLCIYLGFWFFIFYKENVLMFLDCACLHILCTHIVHVRSMCMYACKTKACFKTKKTGASGVPSASHTALMRAEGFKEKGGE